jgi:hypothetical protein
MTPEIRDSIKESYRGSEEGDLFFFYRPRRPNPEGIRDVVSLDMVLRPRDRRWYRLLSFAAPGLGSSDSVTPITGRIIAADRQESAILKHLGPRMGAVAGVPAEVQPACRPCGEGVYALLAARNQTHLVYALELPATPLQVQRELGLQTEGELALGVYNPFESADVNPESPALPRLPDELRRRLGASHALYNDITAFLDYPNLQLVLFRQSQQEARQHTAELMPFWENLETADVFRLLHLRRRQFPIEPLTEGTWR